MTRGALRLGAVLGAAALSTLAIGPAAFADHGSSQATAKALNVEVAGNGVITQTVEAVNDDNGEVVKDGSTVPHLITALPQNSLLSLGAALQQASASPDGTSFACAGAAATGQSSIVPIGDTPGCRIDGDPVDLNLGTLSLGNVALEGGALGTALAPILGPLNDATGAINTQLVGAITGAINDTPLGELSLGGSLGVISGECNANPETAFGRAVLANAEDIKLTLPGGTEVVLVNLPANPDPNTKLLTELDQVTARVFEAVETQLRTMLTPGRLGPVADVLSDQILAEVQDEVIAQVVSGMQPLLEPLEEQVLDITLNKQVNAAGQEVAGSAPDYIEVTAVDIQVLPAIGAATDAPLVTGEIGKVTCGDNARLAHDDPNTGAEAQPGPAAGPASGPAPGAVDIPTQVDSGQSGSNTTAILMGTGALLLVAGVTGLAGYRRMLQQ